MKLSRLLLLIVAIGCVALSLMNASWLAAKPAGGLALIAHHGIAQEDYDHTAAGCPAGRLRAIDHNFIENTVFSLQNALHYGADGLLLDVRASADGRAVIFRDATLECRTNGTGAVAERPLTYLKSLDVGHNYTADGGRHYPLRGRGIGGIATVEEVLQGLPVTHLVYNLTDARAADALIAAYARAGRPIGADIGFIGDPAALARLRQLTRDGWTLDEQASAACLSAYRSTGWLGLMPDSCRGATLRLERKGGWTLWGWPYRFLDRMQAANARFLIAGHGTGAAITGLDDPEQLGEVPHDYAGMLLVEDMWGTGRSLTR